MNILRYNCYFLFNDSNTLQLKNLLYPYNRFLWCIICLYFCPLPILRWNYLPFHHTPFFFRLFNGLVCVLLNSEYFLSDLQCLRQLISWVMSLGKEEHRRKDCCLWRAEWEIAFHSHYKPLQDIVQWVLDCLWYWEIGSREK